MKSRSSSRPPKSLMRQLSNYLVMMGFLLLASLILLFTAAVTVVNNRTGVYTQLTAGALGLVLLVIAFLWLLAHRFSTTLRRQLSSLKTASLALAAGQLGVRVSPLPFAELDDVGQTFNQMAAFLQAQRIELADANNTFRSLLDSTDDAILYVAVDGRILDANRHLIEQWEQPGKSADGIIHRNVMEYMHSIKERFLNAGDLLAFIERTMADTEQDFSMSLSRTLPDPRDYVLYSTPVRGAQEEYLGRFFSIRDVTHEKSVDRMKSEFVSLVSHELRTPLTSIKGYIDLLLREPGQLDVLQRESLEIAQKNARRLVALINDLLDLSHLEEGNIVLRRTMCDVQSIIGDAIQLFQIQLQSREQTLVTDFPSVPTLVVGDPERIAQIFINLLSNAHKYTPIGGRIEISIRQDQCQVEIAVTDSGIGMSAEEQRNLFTRFYRAKNQITQEAGGTGLGLVITKTLVEMHNGEIQVSSAPGEGSTFSFTLPLLQEQMIPLAPTPSTPSGKRLLLVEDDPDQIALHQRYLTEYDFDVLIASTGKSAIHLAETAQPDLICLDIILPDISGLQVLEQLKSQETTACIPVLVLSITDDNGEAYLLGAVDHMRKPVSQSELLRKIQTVLEDKSKPLVLVAESDAVSRVLMAESLKQAGFRVIETFDAGILVSLVAHHRPDHIVANVELLFTQELSILGELLQTCADMKASLLAVGAFPQPLHEQLNELMKAAIVYSIGKQSNVQEVVAAASEMPTKQLREEV